uniref:Uncharacterized protein n=1 Tax=Globodera rostochiensis TaxID=31243 RepID=A0A914HV31_GLORO
MNNNNNNCQFPTPCCRCQLFKAHLVVDPSKAPLSRFDLILLSSFQAAAAAPAAAATASICSTTSSRQSSLVSTADQQQLLVRAKKLDLISSF